MRKRTGHGTLAFVPQELVTCRIRCAERADLDALVALEEACFSSDRLSRRQWQWHASSATAAVLVDGPQGAPWAAAVVLYRRNSRNARLYSLAVATHARGGGCASKLLAAVEADAVRRGCNSMSLEVGTDNRAAIALYKGHGYQRERCLRQFYVDGHDAWRYKKHLDDALVGDNRQG
ncbi:MAG: GNAT family N-acetyltransferase [Sinobacteraceae bacterium]|nr:GNAT family N-acetyltransferase [Nevskiaceae bacterium]